MSVEDVDLVRRGFESFNRGDVEAVLDMCDPEIEWFPPAQLSGVSTYHGHDGVRDAAQDMLDIFGALRAEPESSLMLVIG